MIDASNFYDGQQQLLESDLDECERKLGHTLPDTFRQLYLCSNGGRLRKSLYKMNPGVEEIEIFHFLSIKYNKDFKNDPDFLLEGRVAKLWAEGKLPEKLLPFGIDCSDGFICIDLDTTAIYKYLRLEWDEKLSQEENHVKNSIYLSDSLENFLNALTYAEQPDEDEYVSVENLKPRESNEFYHSEPDLEPADIKTLEQELGIKIPTPLKQFLKQHNGGMPENNVWLNPDEGYEGVAIHELIPVKRASNSESSYLLGTMAKNAWEKETIASSMLPFAIDAGGNYFCLGIEDEQVYYCTFDTWSDNLSVSDNQEKSTSLLSNSFTEFISGLICEDDLDELLYGV